MANDIRDFDIVPVPVKGGTMYVRSFSAQKHLDVLKLTQAKDSTEDSTTFAIEVMPEVLLASVCDAEGKLSYSPDERGLLMERSLQTLTALFTASMKLNAMCAEEVKAVKKK